jgi:hypothetical protein
VQCLETKRDLTQQNSRDAYELSLALELATNKNEGAVTKLKSELVGKRQSHLKEREELQQLVSALQTENSDLASKLEHEKKLRRRSEERFSLEKEGMRSEVLQLKQHLRAMEKRMYFSHMKEESNATSSAQLLASLVSDQFAQQQAQGGGAHHAEDDQENTNGGGEQRRANTSAGAVAAAPKRRVRGASTKGAMRRGASTHKKTGTRSRSHVRATSSSSCPACGTIEENARAAIAQTERHARRSEPLGRAHYN